FGCVVKSRKLSCLVGSSNFPLEGLFCCSIRRWTFGVQRSTFSIRVNEPTELFSRKPFCSRQFLLAKALCHSPISRVRLRGRVPGCGQSIDAVDRCARSHPGYTLSRSYRTRSGFARRRNAQCPDAVLVWHFRPRIVDLCLDGICSLARRARRLRER